jgi:pimeloyl-ACP methyl ester carboxylesterase
VGDVILVHGTTQAAVGWQRLIQELTRRDHRAVAVDLHGAEPSSSIAELAGLCRSQVPADVESPVVVAHSGSGILLPAIAQLVDALHEVYLAAAVPDPTGQLSFLDEMRADPAAMFNPEWLESTQLPIPSWQPTSCSTTATSPPCDGLWGHCDCFPRSAMATPRCLPDAIYRHARARPSFRPRTVRCDRRTWPKLLEHAWVPTQSS